MVTFIAQLLCPEGESCWYLLNRRLCVLMVEPKEFLHSFKELNHGSSVTQPVA